MSSSNDHYDYKEHLAQIPHSNALGLELRSFGQDRCVISIPYSEALVGDPETGVIHGGAITAMLDNVAGMVARPEDMPRDVAAIATLDMRIDYMSAATPGQEILAKAHCFKRTKNVAFVRAEAYQEDSSDPIATCTATFMLGTRNTAFSTPPETSGEAR